MQAAPENRNFVTPFAFNVSEALLGMPLAKPSKRLFAILVDLVLIALLATLNAMVLTAVVGITTLSGYRNLKKHPDRRLAARALLLASFICALVIIAVLVFQGSGLQEKWQKQTDAITQVSEESATENSAEEGSEEVVVQMQLGTDDQTEASGSESSNSLISWVRGVVRDLGLSFGWAAMYFTVFVSWMNGQTPGKRLFGIRVIAINGKELNLWDSFGRYGGYGAGLATGLLGFLQIYWDPNRQSIQDKISETMVIDLRKRSKQEREAQEAAADPSN